jgi:hypothetical protein
MPPGSGPCDQAVLIAGQRSPCPPCGPKISQRDHREKSHDHTGNPCEGSHGPRRRSVSRHGRADWLGTADGAVISYQVGDVPASKRLATHAELDFTVAASLGGMTGIRADAEMIPPRATCLRSADPAGSGAWCRQAAKPPRAHTDGLDSSRVTRRAAGPFTEQSSCRAGWAGKSALTRSSGWSASVRGDRTGRLSCAMPGSSRRRWMCRGRPPPWCRSRNWPPMPGCRRAPR